MAPRITPNPAEVFFQPLHDLFSIFVGWVIGQVLPSPGAKKREATTIGRADVPYKCSLTSHTLFPSPLLRLLEYPKLANVESVLND